MESGYVTTPFGRRSMTLGMLVSQKMACKLDPAKSVDKWKVYRALCEAKPLLGLTDRALAVLSALLSFYPKNELSESNGLVVFPSNAQLSLRSHGMAEQTIRRHLAALIQAGLLIRKDSPNGKRYARRDRGGELNQAFGFSLAPLLARAEEIEHLAASITAERLHLQHLRERISLCRRDITKLIETALVEHLAGDWKRIFIGFRHLIDELPRNPSVGELEGLHDNLTILREDIVKRLEMQLNTQKLSGNPYQNERHIQNSEFEYNSESEGQDRTEHKTQPDKKNKSTLEPPMIGADKPIIAKPIANSIPDRMGDDPGQPKRDNLKSFPLSLILQACQEISAYGPSGRITSWRDLMSAAVVVRSMLDVSSSAYEDAVSAMGPENTAAVMACILERGMHINSAGGYLRDLTRRAEKGQFTLGPMLMALLRTNGPILLTRAN